MPMSVYVILLAGTPLGTARAQASASPVRQVTPCPPMIAAHHDVNGGLGLLALLGGALGTSVRSAARGIGEHDRQRGGWVKLPVGQHGGQERLPASGPRREPGTCQQYGDQCRPRAQQPDARSDPRPAHQLAQLDADHGSTPLTLRPLRTILGRGLRCLLVLLCSNIGSRK